MAQGLSNCYVKAQGRDLAIKFYHIFKLKDRGSGASPLGKNQNH